MFGSLFRFARCRSSAPPPRFRPGLEKLEDRDCPTATLITNMSVVNIAGSLTEVTGTVQAFNPQNVEVDFSGVLSGSTQTFADGAFLFTGEASGPGGFTASTADGSTSADGVVEGPGYGPAGNGGPTITNLAVVGVHQGVVEVSGIVQDTNAQTVTVNFGGAISGSTSPDANGLFTLSAQLGVKADSLGVGEGVSTITAQAVDPSGQSSYASCSLPTSSFGDWGFAVTGLNVVNTGGTSVVVSGTVQDSSPANDTVCFGGVVSGSTTPNSDGTFSFSTQASGVGAISAQAVNQNNQSSKPMFTEITSNVPVITNVNAEQISGDLWYFSGTVSDASPGTCQVQFAAPAESWDGTTLSVNGDGSFGYFATLSGTVGGVSVQATNAWGLQSSTVSFAATGGNPVALPGPTITNFTVTYGSNNTITLTGTVQDSSGQPVEVFFSGTPSTNGACTTTDNNGNFSLSIVLDAGETGTVYAEALNCYFVLSPVVARTIP